MVFGPPGGASVWPITANGPGGPFSLFILDLSRAGGTPVPLAPIVSLFKNLSNPQSYNGEMEETQVNTVPNGGDSSQYCSTLQLPKPL
jgi:hypothetical protein